MFQRGIKVVESSSYVSKQVGAVSIDYNFHRIRLATISISVLPSSLLFMQKVCSIEQISDTSRGKETRKVLCNNHNNGHSTLSELVGKHGSTWGLGVIFCTCLPSNFHPISG